VIAFDEQHLQHRPPLVVEIRRIVLDLHAVRAGIMHADT
jgi:hypothetical protein